MAHAGGTFTARLSHLDGVELDRRALESGTMAERVTARGSCQRFSRVARC